MSAKRATGDPSTSSKRHTETTLPKRHPPRRPKCRHHTASKIDFWFFLTSLTTSAFCNGDTRPAQENRHARRQRALDSSRTGTTHRKRPLYTTMPSFFEPKRQSLAIYIARPESASNHKRKLHAPMIKPSSSPLL